MKTIALRPFAIFLPFYFLLSIATITFSNPLWAQNQEAESTNQIDDEYSLGDGSTSSWASPEKNSDEEKNNSSANTEKNSNEKKLENKAAIKQQSLARKIEIGFGLGSLTQFAHKVQVSEGGDRNNFQLNPYLAGSLKLHFTPSLMAIPSLGVLFPKKGRDDYITKTTYFTLLELGYLFHPLTIKGGMGLSMTYIKGKGGEQVLRNGTSSSSFPVPSGTSTSRNVIATLGAQLHPLPEWAGEFQTFYYNLNDKESRAISYTLALIYYFDISH